jgi:phosphoribosylformylglycinamidine cyclo-ligase
VVEKSRVIDGSTIRPGDAVIGLASSGPHSNGYSLIRKVVDAAGADLQMPFAGRTLGEILLEPTHIYVKPLLALAATIPVKGMAHITGGGLTENVPRILPTGMRAVIERRTWVRPPIFDWLQQEGRIADDEMHRVFNCGIGMVVVVAAEHIRETMRHLTDSGERAFLIGEIRARADEPATAIL